VFHAKFTQNRWEAEKADSGHLPEAADSIAVAAILKEEK
jgi:hypothetical protein